MRLARKKVVLVLVEGPSDDTALGIMLNQIYDKDSVYVHIMHGDITTRKGVRSDNIVAKIGNEVRSYAKSHHYSWKDFKQIIHIVDTDGAYIPDDKIILDLECEKVLYQSDGIYTSNPSGIVERNKQKVGNLNRLKEVRKIWNIPYQIYYMSCNLDHVLYNKPNSTDNQKETNAYTFAKRYRNDVEGFVDFMCDSEFSVVSNYKESWDYIETEMNSIERHSNLGICIKAELDAKRTDCYIAEATL